MQHRDYFAWFCQSTPPALKQWLGSSELTQALKQFFEQTLQERTQLAQAAAYRKACPVPGSTAADYCLQAFQLAPESAVLAGIHFFGGDLARPFVGVFAQSRELSPEDMQQASQQLIQAFAQFQPQAVWWWSLAAPDTLRHWPGLALDQRLLIGHIPTLRQQPLPPRSGISQNIQLEADPQGSAYADYEKIFEAFLLQEPSWRGRLAKTEFADYANCAAAGGLYLVKHSGKVAGVLAARPGVIRGIPGWEMMEEILAEPLRGQGLAPYLQRQVIENLDLNQGQLIFGTIDSANTPSLSTALRVGRQDLGGWFFLRPAPAIKTPKGMRN